MCDPVLGEVEVHTEVVVDFSLMYYKSVAVDGSKVYWKYGILEGVNM